ncbi:HET-domain-containing protein [Acephala macrosclerotiorum]|nr:HET-domain-containing protein [Acephala macrosclerotiorum]
MSICTLCHDLEIAPRDYRVALDFPPQHLERSESTGCKTCSVLLSGIKGIAGSISGLSNVRHIYVWGDAVDNKGSLEVDLYLVDTGRQVRLELFMGPQSMSSWKGLKTMPRVSGNTASDEDFIWAVETLNRCVANHEHCNNAIDSKLPTRVLDMGDPSGPLQLHFFLSRWVKLIEPNDMKARYVCLSHCWGTTQTATTKVNNISLHCQGIAFSSLPKTFQDAIVFTRKLGVRYLWIDSLCIIQDSKKDWITESSKMASIYQGSFLTLAATKSSNGDGGCFSSISPDPPDFRVSIGDPSHAVYVREKLHHWDTLAYSQLAVMFPLLTRGWTYQERLLAPRVLHFCEKELVWECLEDICCECSSFKPATRPKMEHFAALQQIRNLLKTEVVTFPAPEEPQLSQLGPAPKGMRRLWRKFFPSSRGFFDSARISEIASFETAQIKELERIEALPRAREVEIIRSQAAIKAKWHTVVRNYSHLKLTVESDRLPAIAGLAREAEECRVGPYLAGLWGDSLLLDLTWRIDHPIPLIGKVECTLICGADSFGEISHGRLEVKGNLFSASLIYTFLDNSALDSGHYKLATGDELIMYADHCLCPQCLLDTSETMKSDSEIFCLELFADFDTSIALVLRPLKSDCTAFERIGIVEWPRSSKTGIFGHRLASRLSMQFVLY